MSALPSLPERTPSGSPRADLHVWTPVDGRLVGVRRRLVDRVALLVMLLALAMGLMLVIDPGALTLVLPDAVAGGTAPP